MVYTALRITISAWTMILCVALCLWVITLDLNAFQRLSLWIVVGVATVGVNVVVWGS